MSEAEEIISIKARRCLECGKLLVSKFGLKHGRGHICKRKYDAAHAAPDPNQITFFDEMEHKNAPNTKKVLQTTATADEDVTEGGYYGA